MDELKQKGTKSKIYDKRTDEMLDNKELKTSFSTKKQESGIEKRDSTIAICEHQQKDSLANNNYEDDKKNAESLRHKEEGNK